MALDRLAKAAEFTKQAAVCAPQSADFAAPFVKQRQGDVQHLAMGGEVARKFMLRFSQVGNQEVPIPAEHAAAVRLYRNQCVRHT